MQLGIRGRIGLRRRWRAEKKAVFRGAVHSPSFNGTEYDSHYIWVRFKIPFYLLRRFLGCVMLYSWVIKTLNKSQEHIRDFPFNFRCGEVTAYCAGSNQSNDKNSIPSDVSVSKRIQVPLLTLLRYPGFLSPCPVSAHCHSSVCTVNR